MKKEKCVLCMRISLDEVWQGERVERGCGEGECSWLTLFQRFQSRVGGKGPFQPPVLRFLIFFFSPSLRFVLFRLWTCPSHWDGSPSFLSFKFGFCSPPAYLPASRGSFSFQEVAARGGKRTGEGDGVDWFCRLLSFHSLLFLSPREKGITWSFRSMASSFFPSHVPRSNPPVVFLCKGTF